MRRRASRWGLAALVPSAWSSDIVDRARNHAAVLQAGAEIIPMATKVLQIGRLTVRSVKMFADGALGSRGAKLFERQPRVDERAQYHIAGCARETVEIQNA